MIVRSLGEVDRVAVQSYGNGYTVALAVQHAKQNLTKLKILLRGISVLDASMVDRVSFINIHISQTHGSDIERMLACKTKEFTSTDPKHTFTEQQKLKNSNTLSPHQLISGL